MEQIDYAILLLAIIILFFSYKNRALITENYMTYKTEFSKADQNTINEAESPLGISSAMPASYNLNTPSNFGNFGIIGSFPAIPICNSCGLEFGCTGFPYDSDDKNETVCRKCRANSLHKNYTNLNEPIYVYARSAGRPRQCRKINNAC